MPLVQLTARDRETLEQAARHSTDARATRRALALLDLADGQAPGQVAARYRVGRSTVYEWVARWSDKQRPKAERLRDAQRPGRPPEQRGAVAEVLGELLPTAPTDHGYRHPAWTTPLLVAHLAREHQLAVSDTTVRRALRGLGYRWKRPRFVLSRRDPNWRQAKGGSRGA
ncbi:helix-turn-helix domain-containing protein [Gemmata sp.]|uniref:helix-turn-helix domain-containing protein n=1 Tax=Gemmata sp. TaxID=1914242 RepID=UPI003F72556B